MKLSSAYLTEHIKEYCTVSRENRVTGEDIYLRPVFLCKEELDGHVVVIDVWDESILEKTIQKEVFCVFAGIEPEAEMKVPYICLKETSAYAVFNLLTELFDQCDLWSQKLQKVIMSNGNIGKILKCGAEFLDNPLVVMGHDFTFIAEAGTEQIPDNLKLFIDDNVNSSFMHEMIQYKTLQNSAQWPVIYPAFIDGCRTMSMDLQVGDQKTHRLILQEVNGSIGESEYCILKELGTYLEYSLAHIPSILEKSGLEDTLLTALSDRTADYIQISRKLNQFNWGSKHEYFCLVLQILYEEESAMTIHGIRRYMKRQFPDSCSLEYEGYIVTFFNLTKLEMEATEVENKLTYFIRDSYLKAGYSRSVRGHMGLRRQYLQAKIALEVGSRIRPYIWIYRFNQMVIPYIMERTTNQLPGKMLCDEGVLELMRMDEELHTQYIPTLRTYLDNQLNATKTANDLFIHRSTFLYRLDKIKEVLQSSLDDPDEIFYLNYSLRLLEQE